MRAKPRWIIGIDEVGRGPLAGPVYVCATMMRLSDYEQMKWTGLTDSKKMTVKAREAWCAKAKALQKQGKLSYAIGKASARTIDRRGIIKAIFRSIDTALSRLISDNSHILTSSDSTRRVYVFLDGGLRAPKEWTNQKTIIRGDQSEKIISLASVIAKVTRDAYMTKMSKKYPLYDWHANKGYGTKAHIIRLKKHGLTPLHRKTYLTRLLDN